MKKILSILVCVLLGISSVWADDAISITVKVSPEGSGSATACGHDYSSNLEREDDQIYSTNEIAYSNDTRNKYKNALADLKAENPAQGYIFSHWEGPDSYTYSYEKFELSCFCNKTYTVSQAISYTLNKQSAEAQVDFGRTGKSASVNVVITGHFRLVITPEQPVIEWIKPEGVVGEYFTSVSLFNAGELSVASVSHTNNGNVGDKSLDVEITRSTDVANLKLIAGKDVGDGDEFIITLVTDNNGYATIKVRISSGISVTFLSPSLGEGSYTAEQTNNGGWKSCENLGKNDNKVEVSLTSTNQFFHTLTAYPSTNYEFYRWVITHADKSTTIKTDNPLNYTVQDEDRITVEFLPDSMAQFVVKGVDGVYYHRLDDAIESAQKSSSKTVVVYSSGPLYKENITPSSDGKYEFTIPSDVTLLVPGDEKYTVTKELRDDDMVDNGTSSCYKYLTLSEDTRIIVNGHICVYSQTSQTQGHNGKPQKYGEIMMRENTEIVLNSGSQLTVFGYITGDPTKSRVLAKNGSKVYESFYFTDWVGGTIAMKLIGNSQRVFPIKQFYIQSIETKLTLQYGAEEYVASGVNVSLGITMQIPLNMIFIAKDTGKDSDKGFFCLNEGTELSKWYDGDNDRQVYEVNRIEEYPKDRTATAKIGVMYANISIAGELDSRDYVLSATNNMDINVYDVSITSVHDLAFMAGSTLYIAPSAEFISKGNIFVYDKEVNNIGFYGASASKLIPIGYTAYHNGAPNKRNENNVKDAQVIVDGKWIVQAGGAHGSGFYTTVEDPLINDTTYGAQIRSNGGGLIDFQTFSNTLTAHY